MSTDVFDADGRLSEVYVQEMFHSYLKSSLAQAKAEHLVDVQMLSSAEGDLMITGKLNHLILHHTFNLVSLETDADCSSQ